MSAGEAASAHRSVNDLRSPGGALAGGRSGGDGGSVRAAAHTQGHRAGVRASLRPRAGVVARRALPAVQCFVCGVGGPLRRAAIAADAGHRAAEWHARRQREQLGGGDGHRGRVDRRRQPVRERQHQRHRALSGAHDVQRHQAPQPAAVGGGNRESGRASERLHLARTHRLRRPSAQA